jgi:light-regulated signal transduction histidine kinase (bacteriophytochrome)
VKGGPVAGSYEFGPHHRYYFNLYVPLSEDTYLISTMDITEIKMAQQRAEEFADRLERSNAELQQFAYVASHDLQEPLRMVMSNLALLKKKYGDNLDPKAKEYVSTAVNGSERMRELVNDILEYSRIESQPREFVKVDMNEVVRTVIDVLHLAKHEARAEVQIDSLPSICADQKQMTQLLTNLVSNAIKFRGVEPPRIRISAEPMAREFVFSVADNGIGIDPKYQENLFKMFSRLHSIDEYPGTGVGLAISKKIVERHGGRIWIQSALGSGTTFFFTIPR